MQWCICGFPRFYTKSGLQHPALYRGCFLRILCPQRSPVQDAEASPRPFPPVCRAPWFRQTVAEGRAFGWSCNTLGFFFFLEIFFLCVPIRSSQLSSWRPLPRFCHLLLSLCSHSELTHLVPQIQPSSHLPPCLWGADLHLIPFMLMAPKSIALSPSLF